MQEFFNKLLDKGMVQKHFTYEKTGIVCGDLKKISGSAGKDVNHFYYDPKENKIDVCYDNVHYGYAYINNEGNIEDNSHRSVFEIVSEGMMLDEIDKNINNQRVNTEDVLSQVSDLISQGTGIAESHAKIDASRQSEISQQQKHSQGFSGR